jgi:phage gp46-like protein
MRILPIASPEEPSLTPDVIWDGAMGDFAPAAANEAGNRGGLAARRQLATAVLLSLMTDCAADPSELREGDEQRGWAGDPLAGEGETALGSKLWLLRRRTVDEVETPRLAIDYARAALQPLIEQRAVAAFEISAEARPEWRMLVLFVRGTDRDGATLVAQRFQVLWEEERQSAVGRRQ